MALKWLVEGLPSLIVQATGTGKTRVAIALTKLLLDARWAKRVLFLCDRKELRKQARNAYNEFINDPIFVVGRTDKKWGFRRLADEK